MRNPEALKRFQQGMTLPENKGVEVGSEDLRSKEERIDDLKELETGESISLKERFRVKREPWFTSLQWFVIILVVGMIIVMWVCITLWPLPTLNQLLGK